MTIVPHINSPAYKALEQSLYEHTEVMLSTNRLPWECVNQIRTWFTTAGPQIFNNLAIAYGDQIGRDAINAAVMEFIQQCMQQMAPQQMQTQYYNTYGNQQPYGMINHNQYATVPQNSIRSNGAYTIAPNRGIRNNTQYGGGGYSTMYDNEATCPVSANTEQSVYPTAEPKNEVQSAPDTANPSVHQPVLYNAPDKTNITVNDFPVSIGQNQYILELGVEYADSLNRMSKYEYGQFRSDIPEMSAKAFLDMFIRLCPDAITRSPWFYCFDYKQYVIVESPPAAVQSLMTDIRQAYTSPNTYTENSKITKILGKHPHELTVAVNRILVNEINSLLKRYICRPGISSVPSISSLEDIPELFNLSEYPDWSILGKSSNCDKSMISILKRSFGKFFGEDSKILEIPKDTAMISGCPDIVIRHEKFNDRNITELQHTDPELLAAFKESMANTTVMVIPNRVCFTNIVPDIVLERLGSKKSGIIHYCPNDNLLTTMIEDTWQLNSKLFECFIWNKHSKTYSEINFGRSLDGDITMSM